MMSLYVADFCIEPQLPVGDTLVVIHVLYVLVHRYAEDRWDDVMGRLTEVLADQAAQRAQPHGPHAARCAKFPVSV